MTQSTPIFSQEYMRCKQSRQRAKRRHRVSIARTTCSGASALSACTSSGDGGGPYCPSSSSISYCSSFLLLALALARTCLASITHLRLCPDHVLHPPPPPRSLTLRTPPPVPDDAPPDIRMISESLSLRSPTHLTPPHPTPYNSLSLSLSLSDTPAAG